MIWSQIIVVGYSLCIIVIVRRWDGDGESKSSLVGCDDVVSSVCKGYKYFAPGICKFWEAMEEYYERWPWLLGSWKWYWRRTERILSKRQALKKVHVEVAYDYLTWYDFRRETWPVLRVHEACYSLPIARSNVVDRVRVEGNPICPIRLMYGRISPENLYPIGCFIYWTSPGCLPRRWDTSFGFKKKRYFIWKLIATWQAPFLLQ